MWNKIDPLIQPIARRVEQTDPRMDIRRDESEDLGRRKRGDDNTQNHAPEWEDTTIVSTIALANFLAALLGDSSALQADEPVSLPPAPHPAAESHTSPDTRYSRATHAYQATGRAVHDRNVELPPAPPPDVALVTLGNDFGDRDKDRMRQAITDLLALSRQGIEEIALERTLAFLDSIEQGIQTATPL